MPVRGRMISATLGASKRFSRLATNDHRLMYVLLIPHADAEGRLDADPRILGGKAFTLLDFAAADIEAGLLDMSSVGLIDLYEVAGERYLEIADFHEHQVIRRKKDGLPLHEAPSRIPPNERFGNVGDQTTVVPQGNHGGTTVVPPESHGGPTVEPPESHGGTTETSAHQYKAIQGNKKGSPPSGGDPHSPSAELDGAAAASGDASAPTEIETQKRESPETQNARPLPRVLQEYLDDSRARQAARPARKPYPWELNPKPIISPTDAVISDEEPF